VSHMVGAGCGARAVESCEGFTEVLTGLISMNEVIMLISTGMLSRIFFEVYRSFVSNSANRLPYGHVMDGA
jgi:hypothetical protein